MVTFCSFRLRLRFCCRQCVAAFRKGDVDFFSSGIDVIFVEAAFSVCINSVGDCCLESRYLVVKLNCQFILLNDVFDS